MANQWVTKEVPLKKYHEVFNTIPTFFGLCRGGTLIHVSGHSSFGIRNNLGAPVSFTRVYAEIASLVSPAIPGSFAKNFVAAI